MGKIVVRVDDRLIHGQTIVAWCPTLAIQEIIAIDDESAKNPMLKSIKMCIRDSSLPAATGGTERSLFPDTAGFLPVLRRIFPVVAGRTETRSLHQRNLI